jgi:hypothetical protein
MSYVIEDFVPVSEAIEGFNENLRNIPDYMKEKIRGIMTPEETEAIYLELEKLRDESPSPLETVMGCLKVHQIMYSGLNRGLYDEELAELYPVDKLNPRHVKLMRKSGLPILEQAIGDALKKDVGIRVKDGMALLETLPKRPGSWSGGAAVLDSSPR